MGNGLGLDMELELIETGVWPVAGIDEAGRGPWAGPVVSAAVILEPGRVPVGLDDSKRLAPEVRERLYEEIMATAEVGIGIADVARIDRDNILAASLWASAEAVVALAEPPRLALMDGNRAPVLACATRTIVGGDGLVASIAAASIVAKVTRDRLMTVLALRYPGYGFERHKGYGTPEHRRSLAELGVSPEHRRSFAPVQEVLALARPRPRRARRA